MYVFFILMMKFNVNYCQLGYLGIFDLIYVFNKCWINCLLKINFMIIEVERNGVVNLYYCKIFLNIFKFF